MSNPRPSPKELSVSIEFFVRFYWALYNDNEEGALEVVNRERKNRKCGYQLNLPCKGSQLTQGAGTSQPQCDPGNVSHAQSSEPWRSGGSRGTRAQRKGRKKTRGGPGAASGKSKDDAADGPREPAVAGGSGGIKVAARRGDGGQAAQMVPVVAETICPSSEVAVCASYAAMDFPEEDKGVVVFRGDLDAAAFVDDHSHPHDGSPSTSVARELVSILVLVSRSITLSLTMSSIRCSFLMTTLWRLLPPLPQSAERHRAMLAGRPPSTLRIQSPLKRPLNPINLGARRPERRLPKSRLASVHLVLHPTKSDCLSWPRSSWSTIPRPSVVLSMISKTSFPPPEVADTPSLPRPLDERRSRSCAPHRKTTTTPCGLRKQMGLRMQLQSQSLLLPLLFPRPHRMPRTIRDQNQDPQPNPLGAARRGTYRERSARSRGSTRQSTPPNVKK